MTGTGRIGSTTRWMRAIEGRGGEGRSRSHGWHAECNVTRRLISLLLSPLGLHRSSAPADTRTKVSRAQVLAYGIAPPRDGCRATTRGNNTGGIPSRHRPARRLRVPLVHDARAERIHGSPAESRSRDRLRLRSVFLSSFSPLPPLARLVPRIAARIYDG